MTNCLVHLIIALILIKKTQPLQTLLLHFSNHVFFTSFCKRKSSQASAREKQKGKQKVTARPKTNQGFAFDDKPLWNHVKVINVATSGGGNRIWSCNYCSKVVTDSYTKVKGHLLKIPSSGVEDCKIILDAVFDAIKREHAQAETRKAQQELNAKNKAAYVSLPEGSDLAHRKKRKGMAPQGPLPDAFNATQRDVADKEAARMFFANGLPFNFARPPYFRQYSFTLANSRLVSYRPPTYDRLRTTLLSQQKEHVNKLLQPFKDTWRKKGVSVCSDGWSDRQRKQLINIMAASVGGAMFIKAIDSSGNTKDAKYVGSLFMEAIKQIGEEHVVQIVTDNATNYKAAGLSIETKFPHIFWTPCVVHSLNLASKNICDPGAKSPHYAQCKWIVDLVSKVNDIRNFVLNHSMAIYIFNQYSDLKLLSVAETRFASSIIMAKRIVAVRSSLEKMVMDANWKVYRVGGTLWLKIKLEM
ncbi:uncharacterized protein LOC131306961 [Rhododendron vialii]|uniref:uncharacterized protein LOC131306961 n=1 Tax=Rhododendron vialii TaxID=182163 RepID=UPI0026605623|nr:uncharacterized protein LOC131306961 [Rhododendron vialii]